MHPTNLLDPSYILLEILKHSCHIKNNQTMLVGEISIYIINVFVVRLVIEKKNVVNSKFNGQTNDQSMVSLI